jgi:cysteinyl-tRNA synthetase
MSKSLGNFITIRDVLKDWPGEVARLAMLKTHYRQPIDWTLRGLEEAARTLDRWYGIVGDVAADAAIPASVLEPLTDDLNTASAQAELHRLTDPAALKAGANLMGFLGQTKSARDQGTIRAAGVDVATVEALIEARRAARGAKDWATSDRVRDELLAMGVTVKDGKDGTTWSVVA